LYTLNTFEVIAFKRLQSCKSLVQMVEITICWIELMV